MTYNEIECQGKRRGGRKERLGEAKWGERERMKRVYEKKKGAERRRGKDTGEVRAKREVEDIGGKGEDNNQPFHKNT